MHTQNNHTAIEKNHRTSITQIPDTSLPGLDRAGAERPPEETEQLRSIIEENGHNLAPLIQLTPGEFRNWLSDAMN